RPASLKKTAEKGLQALSRSPALRLMRALADSKHFVPEGAKKVFFVGIQRGEACQAGMLDRR
ncbi:MAG TPA: hypothetical protein VF175_04630, partial [Lacipirellula sp.]